MEIRTETVKMERRTNRVRKNGKKNVQSQENRSISSILSKRFKAEKNPSYATKKCLWTTEE